MTFVVINSPWCVEKKDAARLFFFDTTVRSPAATIILITNILSFLVSVSAWCLFYLTEISQLLTVNNMYLIYPPGNIDGLSMLYSLMSTFGHERDHSNDEGIYGKPRMACPLIKLWYRSSASHELPWRWRCPGQKAKIENETISRSQTQLRSHLQDSIRTIAF